MLYKTGLFALAVCFWASCPAFAEPNEWDHHAEYEKLLAELSGAYVRPRSMAWPRLKRQREVTIAVLEKIAAADERSTLMAGLRPSTVQHLRRRAIKALGEFRARDASGFLVRHMAEKLPLGYASSYTPFEDYPAAQAILNVGEPAIQSMLAWLGHACSDEHLKLIAYVLWCYYAPQDEQDVGLFRLERRLEREKRQQAESAKRSGKTYPPSVREKNLRALIETYKTIRPNDPTDWPKP